MRAVVLYAVVMNSGCVLHAGSSFPFLNLTKYLTAALANDCDDSVWIKMMAKWEKTSSPGQIICKMWKTWRNIPDFDFLMKGLPNGGEDLRVSAGLGLIAFSSANSFYHPAPDWLESFSNIYPRIFLILLQIFPLFSAVLWLIGSRSDKSFHPPVTDLLEADGKFSQYLQTTQSPSSHPHPKPPKKFLQKL